MPFGVYGCIQATHTKKNKKTLNISVSLGSQMEKGETLFVKRPDGIIIIERLVVVMHHTLLTPFLMCEKKG